MLKEKRAYDAPSVNKSEIIGFEYYINWNVPVVLCEGVFDAMAIKRNAIPLFGKTISRRLMKKLVESEVKTVYIALDKDAVKQAMDTKLWGILDKYVPEFAVEKKIVLPKLKKIELPKLNNV